MSVEKVEFPRAFRISGVLLVLGLCTEAISLVWVHPVAFVVFFVVGGTLLAAGILLFLYSLFLFRASPESHRPGTN